MNRAEINALEHASRAAMAYIPEDEPQRYAKLVTATIPAIGILTACAVMLVAFL